MKTIFYPLPGKISSLTVSSMPSLPSTTENRSNHFPMTSALRLIFHLQRVMLWNGDEFSQADVWHVRELSIPVLNLKVWRSACVFLLRKNLLMASTSAYGRYAILCSVAVRFRSSVGRMVLSSQPALGDMHAAPS